jgi:soluble cytochrome b562
MSKKIAQLTKVIYHLNTRNEDHQSELEAMAYQHQMEIQQLALDAANKIAKFKDVMENKKAAVSLKQFQFRS